MTKIIQINSAKMLTMLNFVMSSGNRSQFAKINSLQQTESHLVKKNQHPTKAIQYPKRTPFSGSCLHVSCNQ